MMQTVANGSGGVISSNSTVIISSPNKDLPRQTAPPPVPSHCANWPSAQSENLGSSGARWLCRKFLIRCIVG